MWFADEINFGWSVFKLAVESADYEAILVDLDNYYGLIDDRVALENRTAKFVIVDLI